MMIVEERCAKRQLSTQSCRVIEEIMHRIYQRPLLWGMLGKGAQTLKDLRDWGNEKGREETRKSNHNYS